MATKVEQAPSVKTQRVQTSVTSSLGASTSSSKVSMFGAKSGFVIPKNKLSGSLVPIFRGAKKVESHDAGKDETNKQAQRKTKWGTDLTQDAGVRRGRALAYQTRVEQITQQLESGVLETEEDQGSQSQTEAPKEDLSVQQVHDQNREALEMEKREVIGEILKLNPRYKAPPDYKPLLKEAKVPIPLKVYPGFNFVGLLLGPGSNTQKRLQEETGAKIRLQGTKAGEAEKGEITLSDGGEDQSAYEELYVHVSADTFDKVDAAVALIELLVTPVSGNAVDVSTSPAPVSGNSMAVLDLSKNIIASYALPAAPINPGVMQPIIGSTRPSLSQVQFQPYPAPWFPMGPPQTQMRPLSNFGLPSNSSVHMPNNAMQFSPSRSTARMQPISVGRSPFAGGFGLAPRNPSLVAPRPQMQLQPPQSLQRQYFPEGQPHGQVTDMRGHSIPGPQPPSQYPSLPAQRNTGPPPHQFIGNQYRNTGPVPVPNHPFSMPQPVSVAPSGSQTNRQLASTGWPASVVNPAPIGQNNMMQPSLSMGPSQRTQVFSQPVATSGPLSSFGSFPSHGFSPQLPNNTPVNRPATIFTSSLPQVGSAPSAPIRLSSAVPSGVVRTPSSLAPPASGLPLVFPRAGDPSLAQAGSSAPSSAPAPSQSPPVAPRPVGSQGQAANMLMVGSTPVLPPVPSVSPRPQPGNSISMSVTVPSFTPVNPPMTSPQSISPVTAPKPQRPSSGDFTFKPLSSQPQASQTVTRPSSDQLVSASTTQTKPINMQPPAPPQAPSFRPATNNGGPQVVMQGFPSSRPSDQFLQPQSPVPAPSPGSVTFSGNRSPMPPPPRPPTFPNRNPVPPTSPVSQMRPQGFMQPPQMSPLPPQRVNPLQLQQNQAASTVRPGNLFLPNQQHINNVTFSGKPASSPGGNQVYDPFSPTSIPSAPQQVENPTKGGNHENDPEYNDLMASVGMK